jgi:hypothetical protein
MTRVHRSPRLASAALAALAAWSACAAAAPGVPGSTGFDAAVRRSGPIDAHRVLEAELRDEAFHLWAAGGFGADRTERAAWVVRAASGVAWRVWPWDRRYLESRWLGPTPAGAMAIVHTHPASVDPRPSPTDVATARRLEVTVYTVSRTGIWKAGPDGAVTRVGDERWWAGCEARKHCRESASVRLALASNEKSPRDETTARALRITE